METVAVTRSSNLHVLTMNEVHLYVYTYTWIKYLTVTMPSQLTDGMSL